MADYLSRILSDGTVKQYPLMDDAGTYGTHVLKINSGGTVKYIPLTAYETGDNLRYVDADGNDARLSTKGELHVKIAQSANQTISANVVGSFGEEIGQYTGDFYAPYGADVYLDVTPSSEAYETGTITVTEGSVAHTFDASTGAQTWTWSKDVEAGANGPSVLNVDADTEYTITGNGTSGAMGYRYKSTVTYFVIEDFYTGTTASDWNASKDIYAYFTAHKFKAYPANSPEDYIAWTSPTSTPQNDNDHGVVVWASNSGSPTVADGKTVSEVRTAINTAYENGEYITYEVYD